LAGQCSFSFVFKRLSSIVGSSASSRPGRGREVRLFVCVCVCLICLGSLLLYRMSQEECATMCVHRRVSQLLSSYKPLGVVISAIFANVRFYIHLVNIITKLLGLLQHFLPFTVPLFTTFFVALFGPGISLLFSLF